MQFAEESERPFILSSILVLTRRLLPLLRRLKRFSLFLYAA